MKKVLLVSCEGLGNGGVQSVMMSIVRNLNDNIDRGGFCSYGRP